jgi:hypothetical protein
MLVSFHREAGRAYHSFARRPDGVVVRLKGGSYNPFDPPLPHDVAHLVVEDELGLDRGLWGVIAAGGMFPQNAVVSGRQKPHAAQRARSVVKAAQEDLNQAEIVVGAVCRIVHGGLEHDQRLIDRLTGRWRPGSLIPDAIPRISERLRDAAARWDAVPVGGSLELVWGEARSRS